MIKRCKFLGNFLDAKPTPFYTISDKNYLSKRERQDSKPYDTISVLLDTIVDVLDKIVSIIIMKIKRGRESLYLSFRFRLRLRQRQDLRTFLTISSENHPQEYLNCFNLNEELRKSDPMEVEEFQQDLYSTAALEWHYWQPGYDLEPHSKKAEDQAVLKGIDGPVQFSANSRPDFLDESK